MLSLKQLDFFIDSLQTPYHEFVNNRADRVYKTLKAQMLMADTVQGKALNPDIIENFTDKNKKLVSENAFIATEGNLDNLDEF